MCAVCPVCSVYSVTGRYHHSCIVYSLLCQPADTNTDIYIRLSIDPTLCTPIAHVISCIRLCNIGGRAGVGLASVMCHFSVLNVSGRWHVVNVLYIGAAGEGEVLGAWCLLK